LKPLVLTEEEASLVLSNDYRETEILGATRGYIFWCLRMKAPHFGTTRTHYVITRATIKRSK
jgi:hypothetical protein